MKRKIQGLLALLCILTVFTSCAESDTPATPSGDTPGKLVTLPPGVVSKGFTLQTVRIVNTIDGERTAYEKKNVQVAFDGQDVYVSGLSTSCPESFVKGTLTGAGTCQFKSGQYVGADKTGEKYVVGVLGTENKAYQLTDFECSFDAEMHTLTIPEGATFAIAEADAPNNTQVSNITKYVKVMPGSFPEPPFVTLPEGVTTQQWYLTGASGMDYCMNYGITIAFDGQDVYVQGLFQQMPLTWLHGRLEGNVITIEGKQFLGYYTKWQDMLFDVSGEGSPHDLRLNYDAEKGIMETDDVSCMIDIDKNFLAEYVSQIYITKQRHIGPDPIFPPAGVTYEPYRFDCESIIIDEGKVKIDGNEVNEAFIAIDGNDVYMRLFTSDANGWARGTLSSDGHTITFPALQYIGTWHGPNVNEDHYLTAFTDEGSHFAPADVVMNYNAGDGSISCNQMWGVSSSYRVVSCLAGNTFGKASFTKKKDVAATPEAPEVSIEYNVFRNFIIANLKISLIGVGDIDLLSDKLSYKLWYEKDGQPHELVFRASEQEELDTDIVEFPYRFHTPHEFVSGGGRMEIHKPLSEVLTWTKIGAQTIYRGGGEEHLSPITWFDATAFYKEEGLIK